MVLTVIILGTLWLLSTLEPKKPAQLYPATIDRDCAPWDGAAFTISILGRDAATIHISIYQSPKILHPAIFSFPDETLRKGNVVLLRPAGLPEQLTGKVFFERIEAGKPVEGQFDLISEGGEKLTGKFRAEWGNQVVYCG
jgi:hypothetical protein